jgi:hypothetical protein
MLPVASALGEESYGSTTSDLKAKDAVPRCGGFTGTYSIKGEALPGHPAYFRVKTLGLTLDRMLGQEIALPEINRARVVELIYRDAKIELVFWSDEGVLQHKFISPPESEITCNQHQLIIKRDSEGKGEAESGIVHTVDTLTLAEDGPLLLNVVITGRSRGFIFFSTFIEEYAAVFKKVTIPSMKK